MYKKIAIKALITIIPIAFAVFSIFYFNNQNFIISNNLLNEEQGRVAGISQNNIQDLSEDIPIFPESEISSFSTNNNSAFVTLETNKDEKEIKIYYDDYLLLNNWIYNDGVYKKDDKELKIDISEGIIKINLTK